MEDNRYSRQVLFEPLGEEGQQRLGTSSVAIIGCGALGTVIANCLARSGVGKIKVVDRDFVELDNLQRQVLFDEEDARRMLPKALAAVKHLEAVNSSVRLSAEVCDVSSRNIESVMAVCDLVLDATDNLETRLLINDACVKAGIPWIHGTAVGSIGMEMPFIPGKTACFRCYLPELPPDRVPGCDVIGVLNPITGIVGCLQSSHAIQVLTGNYSPRNEMIYIDIWQDEFLEIDIERVPDCPCCGQRSFPYLDRKQQTIAVAMCGRDAIQVTPPTDREIDLEELGRDLSRAGKVEDKGFLLTFKTGEFELIVFPDGRAIIKGARDAAHARSLYSRFISA